jgi:uncharacterized membrane protein
MADLIAIGYSDESTAEEAAREAQRLSDELITVLRTSLPHDAERQIQQALHGSPVPASS